MKRKVQIPSKPTIRPAGEQPPRERRKLGIRFDVVTGDGVSGLR
jgi:hypothetical protein